MPYLSWMESGQLRRCFLEGGCQLGRDPLTCSVSQPGDPSVSRQHAVVELSGGGYLVTDLGSANGTFINDAPVITPTRLRVGDQVKFGGTVFRFQPLYEMK